MSPTNKCRIRIFVLTLTTAGVALVAAACSDDETTPPPAASDQDGSVTPAPTNPDNSSGGSSGDVPDAGEEELVSDDGTEPPPVDDEDGGLTDLDAGLDAGPACQALKTGAFVATTCTPLPARLLSGGTLTTTTYELTSVTVIGTKATCAPAGGYDVREHRGALRVTASSETSATFEFIDQFRAPGSNRVASRRWDVQVAASGNTLTFKPQACAVNPAPAQASYGVGTASGKKTITLRLPWGTSSEALYRYTEL